MNPSEAETTTTRVDQNSPEELARVAVELRQVILDAEPTVDPDKAARRLTALALFDVALIFTQAMQAPESQLVPWHPRDMGR